MIWDIAWVGVFALLVALVGYSIRILREYDRGVVFTLGRLRLARKALQRSR